MFFFLQSEDISNDKSSMVDIEIKTTPISNSECEMTEETQETFYESSELNDLLGDEMTEVDDINADIHKNVGGTNEDSNLEVIIKTMAFKNRVYRGKFF